MKTSKGKSTINELLSTSHVAIVNKTYDGLERLGLSVDQIRKINPSIILAHFDAWSGPRAQSGSLTGTISYDDNVQASLGIMERFGGTMDKIEEHAHIGTIDVIAGFSGAFVTVAALYNLFHTNRACVAKTSLSSVGQMIQLPFSCGSLAKLKEEHSKSVYRDGVECRGECALDRYYEVLGGEYVFICDMKGKVDDLCGAFGLENTDRDGELQVALEEAFGRVTYERASMILTERNICHVKLESLDEVRSRNIVNAFDLRGQTYQFTVCQHEIGTLQMTAPVSIRMPPQHMRVHLEDLPSTVRTIPS